MSSFFCASIEHSIMLGDAAGLNLCLGPERDVSTKLPRSLTKSRLPCDLRRYMLPHCTRLPTCNKLAEAVGGALGTRAGRRHGPARRMVNQSKNVNSQTRADLGWWWWCIACRLLTQATLSFTLKRYCASRSLKVGIQEKEMSL
jgi:hypothetical protein